MRLKVNAGEPRPPHALPGTDDLSGLAGDLPPSSYEALAHLTSAARRETSRPPRAGPSPTSPQQPGGRPPALLVQGPCPPHLSGQAGDPPPSSCRALVPLTSVDRRETPRPPCAGPLSPSPQWTGERPSALLVQGPRPPHLSSLAGEPPPSSCRALIPLSSSRSILLPVLILLALGQDDHIQLLLEGDALGSGSSRRAWFANWLRSSRGGRCSRCPLRGPRTPSNRSGMRGERVHTVGVADAQLEAKGMGHLL